MIRKKNTRSELKKVCTAGGEGKGPLSEKNHSLGATALTMRTKLSVRKERSWKEPVEGGEKSGSQSPGLASRCNQGERRSWAFFVERGSEGGDLPPNSKKIGWGSGEGGEQYDPKKRECPGRQSETRGNEVTSHYRLRTQDWGKRGKSRDRDRGTITCVLTGAPPGEKRVRHVRCGKALAALTQVADRGCRGVVKRRTPATQRRRGRATGGSILVMPQGMAAVRGRAEVRTRELHEQRREEKGKVHPSVLKGKTITRARYEDRKKKQRKGGEEILIPRGNVSRRCEKKEKIGGRRAPDYASVEK